MTEVEKERLVYTLQATKTGKIDALPTFIIDSNSDGLKTLSNELIKTGFLN